jgi:hypothetical protein
MQLEKIGDCELYHADCLDVMPELKDSSIHSVIVDLPYGTTYCSWDEIIPFDKLWEQYKRLIINNGAFVFTASQPFITNSLYKRGDKVIYSKDVDSIYLDYVKDRIEEWTPHDAFVIDVCDTENGIKIVEINTLNSSGFYAADVQKLVLTLEESYNVLI